MVHVDFVALPELTREPPGKLPEIDQKYLQSHASSRGLTKYDYSDEEHKRRRKLAMDNNASEEFIHNFDRTFNFIYWMTIRARTGKINSIGGMCYDIALKNYADLAEVTEKESAKPGGFS